MRIVIIIPSRMASKRFPGKPLAKIDGIPMIQRVWQQANAAQIGDVFVACSENDVFDLIKGVGGNPIMTDPNLPSGTDRIHSALQKINNYSEIDYIINLQGDMPLIESHHIKKVIEPLKNNYQIGTMATDLKKDEILNSNITKVIVDWRKNKLGHAKEFFRQKKFIIDQAYHHVGIYSYLQETLKSFVNLPKSKNEVSLNLEQYRAMDAGMSIGIAFEKNIPISIDTKEDLITAESIIRANNEKN